MEGDMKEIVLERLEQRLKEKDEEIRGLKKEVQASSSGNAGDLKNISGRIDRLEMDVRETQITLSEVMKKVGALEGALNSLLISMASEGEEAYPGDGMTMPGSMPGDPQHFDKFAADLDQKDINQDPHKDTDALRFFHLSRNS